MQPEPSTEPIGKRILRQPPEQWARLVHLAKVAGVPLGPASGIADESVTVLDLMTSPRWFASWFAGDGWLGWKAFLAGIFGLPMTEPMLARWQEHTRRTHAPTTPAPEAWMVVGRRGGKSRIAALIAVYLACFRNYARHLAEGEVATIPIIAADRREARTVMRYLKGFLSTPQLQHRVVRTLTESVELQGRIQVELHTAGYRAVRGYTVAAAICDEIAFWRTDSEAASPDHEVLAALRPGMASIPGSLLIGLSSPYARSGVLWEMYDRHFGQEHPEVVWQADTRAMNATIDPQLIAEAYRNDPDAAAAEYGAEFRRDVESFVSREAVRDAVVSGRDRIPYVAGTRYVAFVDPSGGAVDSMTLGIAHAEGPRAVLDCVLEVRPPFSPAAVVVECVNLVREYNVASVTGDRYGGEWPRERFRALGVAYELSELVKSDIYIAFLSRMNSRQVELLDNHVLIRQLQQLERRRGRGGRDTVDHPPKGHDDVVNAAAGALTLAVVPERAVMSRRLGL